MSLLREKTHYRISSKKTIILKILWSTERNQTTAQQEAILPQTNKRCLRYKKHPVLLSIILIQILGILFLKIADKEGILQQMLNPSVFQMGDGFVPNVRIIILAEELSVIDVAKSRVSLITMESLSILWRKEALSILMELMIMLFAKRSLICPDKIAFKAMKLILSKFPRLPKL